MFVTWRLLTLEVIAAFALVATSIAAAQGVARLPTVDVTISGDGRAATFSPPPVQGHTAPVYSEISPLTTPHSPLITDHSPLAPPNPHIAEPGTWFEDNHFADGPKRISDIKSGVVQRLSFLGSWMPAAQDGDLGASDLELYGVFGFPFPTTESPLLVTPLFAVHYLDGPLAPDLPPRLFDASLQFRWFKKLPFAPWITADLAIEPGVHGDFDQGDADAFRLPGHGLAILEWGPKAKVVIGVLYLDREDVNILPAGGVIYAPDEDTQLDLVFPKPKIARRFYADGRTELWNYLAAEFGGGPYSIRRDTGDQDVIIWRDYRLFYGLERKRLGGMNTKIEVGYVLGRTIEYINTATPDFEADATLLLRAGVSY